MKRGCFSKACKAQQPVIWMKSSWTSEIATVFVAHFSHERSKIGTCICKQYAHHNKFILCQSLKVTPTQDHSWLLMQTRHWQKKWGHRFQFSSHVMICFAQVGDVGWVWIISGFKSVHYAPASFRRSSHQTNARKVVTDTRTEAKENLTFSVTVGLRDHFSRKLVRRFFTKLTTTPPRDNCNVNVADLNNALYAITDVGHAYKFDPDTLDTQTFIDMNEICGVPVATAHPHYGKLNVTICDKRCLMANTYSCCQMSSPVVLNLYKHTEPLRSHSGFC